MAPQNLVKQNKPSFFLQWITSLEKLLHCYFWSCISHLTVKPIKLLITSQIFPQGGTKFSKNLTQEKIEFEFFEFIKKFLIYLCSDLPTFLSNSLCIHFEPVFRRRIHIAVDTGRKLNVLCTFTLRPVSTGNAILVIVFCSFTCFSEGLIRHYETELDIELSRELLNHLRLRILGKKKIYGKSQN